MATDTPPPFQVLCVSDIDHVSREEHLWQAFAPWAHGIRSIRLIRDVNKPFTLTHAYINFTNHDDAEDALRQIQPLFINSSYCRVVPFDGDRLLKPPRYDQSAGQGVFIKNLDVQVTVAMLWGYFMGFGKIVGCRVAIDEFGVPRGFAYITYEAAEQAAAALKAMDGQLIGRRRIFASQNLPKNQRGTRIFVKFESSESPKPTAADIRAAFEKYGELDSVSAPRDPSGELRGFAFATFREHADAMRVIEEVKNIAGVACTVDLATAHRSAPLPSSAGATPGPASASSPNPGSVPGSATSTPVPGRPGSASNGNTNLYVRPLGPEVHESDLAEEFKKYGEVLSTKIMLDATGNSRGFGFVSFGDAESAANAIAGLHGVEKWGQILYVAPAQSRRQLAHPLGHFSPVHHHHHRHARAMHPQLGMPLPGALPAGISAAAIPGSVPGGMPGVYYIPVEYTYDYSYAPALTGASPINSSPINSSGATMSSMPGTSPVMVPSAQLQATLEKASVEELGEMLHPHVVQHVAIGGNLDLASKITGILLQQPKASIISWLENPMLMDIRIQQGYDAFQEWLRQNAKETSLQGK